MTVTVTGFDLSEEALKYVAFGKGQRQKELASLNENHPPATDEVQKKNALVRQFCELVEDAMNVPDIRRVFLDAGLYLDLSTNDHNVVATYLDISKILPNANRGYYILWTQPMIFSLARRVASGVFRSALSTEAEVYLDKRVFLLGVRMNLKNFVLIPCDEMIRAVQELEGSCEYQYYDEIRKVALERYKLRPPRLMATATDVLDRLAEPVIKKDDRSR